MTRSESRTAGVQLAGKLLRGIKRLFRGATQRLLTIVLALPPARLYNTWRLRGHVGRNDVVALHLGCGSRHFEGWINIDIYPSVPPPDILLDITKGIPLPDKSVDFLYSEDVIEHLPLSAGRALLAECARLLKPSGILRLGTPDLRLVAQLYLNRDSDTLAWYKQNQGAETYAEMFNAGMRAWGHQFLYDEELLTKLLEDLGLDVVRVQPQKSDSAMLRGLDFRGPASVFLEAHRR